MAKLKEGERVRVLSKDLSDEQRAMLGFFTHMEGLTGTVENWYSATEIAVKVDLESLGKIPLEVHQTATDRMRAKFLDSVGEEQKKLLSKEELDFVPNYVILVREEDLEKI